MSSNKNGVRFIRINGRVVPIRSKSRAPAESSRQIGVGKGAMIGAAAGGALGARWGLGLFKKSLRVTTPLEKRVMRKAIEFGQLANPLKPGRYIKGALGVAGGMPGIAVGALAGAAIGSIKFRRKGK